MPAIRRRLGVLLASAALLVAGCGSSSTSSGAAGDASSGPVAGAHVLTLLPVHAVAGQVSEQAVPLGTPAQVTAFVQQFPSASVRQRVRAALQKALGRSGTDVVGAVVASGCDVPPGVTVTADGSGGVRIVAQEVASPIQECLVPVTTIALVELPAS